MPRRMPTPQSPILAFLAVLAMAMPLSAQEPGAPEAADTSRQTFNTEVCAVDDLTSAQCQCAWEFLQKKLSPRDLRLAMLIVASNSDNDEVSRKAFGSLDKSNVPDRKRDELAAEISALTVEAEDACPP